jgi:hypothetical protein
MIGARYLVAASYIVRKQREQLSDNRAVYRHESVRSGAISGGIRGDEAVVGEAGGLPLDTRTASRSAAPGQYSIPLRSQYQQSLILTV